MSGRKIFECERCQSFKFEWQTKEGAKAPSYHFFLVPFAAIRAATFSAASRCLLRANCTSAVIVRCVFSTSPVSLPRYSSGKLTMNRVRFGSAFFAVFAIIDPQ